MSKKVQIDVDGRPALGSVCIGCIRVLSLSAETCEAFPDPRMPIPTPIWSGENLHIDSFPGDNGMRYSPLTEHNNADDLADVSEEDVFIGTNGLYNYD